MTGNPALIDTNLLVYAFDADSGDKQQAAQELLSRCWRHEMQFAVSTQNLAEFSAIVREKVSHPASGDEVRAFLYVITEFRDWTILTYGAETVIRAHEIRDNYSLHFWDALLVATMEENSIRTIYTEDKHFARVPWLKRINPFE
ncbi:MAG: PIN domain-containing protein [Methanoregula sp.]|nr:PIN domain-containing protein [Methanoregula sp.]MDD5023687.1 PIN domain-containing protein [Methanoregula sp.]